MKIVNEFTGMIIILNANKPKIEPNIRMNQDEDYESKEQITA